MKPPFAVLLVLVITAMAGALGELRGIQIRRDAPPQSQPAVPPRQGFRNPPPGTPSAAAVNSFPQWLKDGDKAEINWSTSVPDPTLQMNQMLSVRYSATTKVRNLNRLGVDSELVFLFRADRVDSADSSRPFPESFDSIPVPKDAPKNVEIEFSGVIYPLPGDYDFWMAIYDGASKKHSIKRHRVHISTIQDDPLPRLELQTAPGKMSLTVSNKIPLAVELISADRNSAGLEILAQMKLVNSSISVAALNIENQQVIFDQRDVHQLDFWRLSQARSTTATGVAVDVDTLLTRKKQSAFLRDYIRRRLETSSTPLRVVILLSGLVSFPSGNDLAPLVLGRDCRCRIFHLQFGYARQEDDVQKLLKPLQPRHFEIVTPLDLRKALASIVQELESL